MSTKKDSSANEIAALEKAAVPTKIDEAAAKLEQQLQYEIDHRKEERFFWIFSMVILVDFIAFPSLGVAWIGILLLEIVLLIALAKWLGVDSVVVFLERIFSKYLKDSDNEDN